MKTIQLALLFTVALMVASEDSAKTSLKTLERDLLEIEILLKELDVQLSKEIAYGWREDVKQKIDEWRDSVRDAFGKIRSSIQKFLTSLTTRKGERLPEWVYTGFGGAMEDVLKYLESRLEGEDDAFRTAVLEVLKNTVRIYRNRIKEASEKPSPAPQPPSPPQPTEEEPTSTPDSHEYF